MSCQITCQIFSVNMVRALSNPKKVGKHIIIDIQEFIIVLIGQVPTTLSTVIRFLFLNIKDWDLDTFKIRILHAKQSKQCCSYQLYNIIKIVLDVRDVFIIKSFYSLFIVQGGPSKTNQERGETIFFIKVQRVPKKLLH